MDKSGEIIVLEPPCPWKDHLYDLEKKISLPESCIKFVLYKDTDSDQWRVQVNVESVMEGEGGEERERERERERDRERERER